MSFDNFTPYLANPEIVDHIVCKLKAQGIFDQFRKDCLADVDTKPAYQNLQQRVNSQVNGFLTKHKWQHDLNKTQLRENLRRHVQQSYLEVGVDRIVDQVVNPKIDTVFLPKVEDVVYECLGIEKPKPKAPDPTKTSGKKSAEPTKKPPEPPAKKPPAPPPPSEKPPEPPSEPAPLPPEPEEPEPPKNENPPEPKEDVKESSAFESDFKEEPTSTTPLIDDDDSNTIDETPLLMAEVKKGDSNDVTLPIDEDSSPPFEPINSDSKLTSDSLGPRTPKQELEADSTHNLSRASTKTVDNPTFKNFSNLNEKIKQLEVNLKEESKSPSFDTDLKIESSDTNISSLDELKNVKEETDKLFSEDSRSSSRDKRTESKSDDKHKSGKSDRKDREKSRSDSSRHRSSSSRHRSRTESSSSRRDDKHRDSKKDDSRDKHDKREDPKNKERKRDGDKQRSSSHRKSSTSDKTDKTSEKPKKEEDDKKGSKKRKRETCDDMKPNDRRSSDPDSGAGGHTKSKSSSDKKPSESSSKKITDKSESSSKSSEMHDAETPTDEVDIILMQINSSIEEEIAQTSKKPKFAKNSHEVRKIMLARKQMGRKKTEPEEEVNPESNENKENELSTESVPEESSRHSEESTDRSQELVPDPGLKETQIVIRDSNHFTRRLSQDGAKISCPTVEETPEKPNEPASEIAPNDDLDFRSSEDPNFTGFSLKDLEEAVGQFEVLKSSFSSLLPPPVETNNNTRKRKLVRTEESTGKVKKDINGCQVVMDMLPQGLVDKTAPTCEKTDIKSKLPLDQKITDTSSRKISEKSESSSKSSDVRDHKRVAETVETKALPGVDKKMKTRSTSKTRDQSTSSSETVKPVKRIQTQRYDSTDLYKPRNQLSQRRVRLSRGDSAEVTLAKKSEIR